MSIKGFWVKGQVQKYDYQELENLPLEKIFWAVYNTTTFADIETASNAGKIVMLKLPAQLNNVIIPLSCFTTDGGTKHAEFYGVSGSGNGNSYVYIAYCDEGTDFWSMSRQLISGLAPVQRVNNKTGNVVLDASDVGALPASTVIPSKTSDLINDSGFVNDSRAVTVAPVQSVNGQTGAVTVPVLPSGGTAGQVLMLMPGFPAGSDPVPAWENPTIVIFDFTLDADSQVTSGPTWAEVNNVADSKFVFARATKTDGTILLMPLVDGKNYIFSAIDHLGAIHSIIPGQSYHSWEYTDNAIGEDVTALWNEKLDNNFGSSEAGKILVVGSDGAITAVTMAEWQGGNY